MAVSTRNIVKGDDTLLLASGAALIFMAFMRFSLAELGWIAFAPLLAYVYADGGVRRHLAVLGVLIVAFLAAVSKIATSEIPWALAPMFAAPIALSYFAAIAVAGFAHRRLGARWGVYTFASMTTALGWIQYTFTPGASWGVLAHTQVDRLALVQLAALTGVGGVTFLVALGSGLAAAAWHRGVRDMRADLLVFLALVASALIYGELRLSQAAPGAQVRIGGIVSPVTHEDFFKAAQDVDSVRHLDDELFARSARAAELGAKAVVWNEVATVTTVAGEAELASRGQAFAQERGVLLLMAYGVVTSTRPLHYVNKYRIYLPDGALADEYIKRHPVPGDPNDMGTRHARVVQWEGVRYSGGICYDYSFPEIALDNARDGADIALAPASDWRGIDPLHAKMAVMNAVAAGLPMMRPVRAATSLATDQYGRVLASLRADAVSDGVFVAAMPAQRVPTLFARIGEAVPILALAFCVLVVARTATRRTRAAK